MSRSIYDFLNDSILLDETMMAQAYRGVSEQRLVGELNSYREHVVERLEEIRAATVAPTEGPKAYVGGAANTTVDRVTLRRMALYFDRAIVDDPLLKFTRQTSADTEAFSRFLGFDGRGHVDRNALVETVNLLLATRPLVGHDFLLYAPISLANEPPTELGLSYSPTLFSERVPDGVREWLRSRARISRLERVEEGWAIRRDAPLEPCRAIAIELDGFSQPMIFRLSVIQNDGVSEDPNTVRLLNTLPDEPPGNDEFDTWVQQSLNQFAGDVFDKVIRDVANTAHSSAMMLTDSELIGDLLSLRTNTQTVEQDIAELVLDLELPSVDSASEADLMRIRSDYGTSFETFRIELERGLRGISSEQNSDIQRRMLIELRHEFEELRVREIRQSITGLRRDLLGDTAVGAISLAATVQTGGLTLIGLLGALLDGSRRVIDYQRGTRENPGHFLWKLRGG